GVWKGHGDRAYQFAVDVHRAAAHPLHDAGVFEGPAGEARENQRFLGPKIVEHSENFDLEILDAIPGEHGAARAVHTGTDVLESKERGLSRERSGQRESRRSSEAEHLSIVPARKQETATEI